MPKGVRLNPEHDERTRAKIQTSQILNRLIKHVKGEVDMQNTQIRAAEILLRKTLPDLSSVEMTQKPGKSEDNNLLEEDKKILENLGLTKISVQ